MTLVAINWMQGTGNEIANYFAEGDYYLDKNTEAHWHGKHAELIGCIGKVSKEDLKSVLNNRMPIGGRITQRDVDGRRRGLEIVFSAPKSLSVLDAIAGDSRIRDAFNSTVALTMNEVEKDAGRRNRDKGQEGFKHTGNIVYATFPHQLGRPVKGVPDPQMHSHAVITNCTYESDKGKWYALEAENIIRNHHYYESFFRATLAKQLEGMGYKLDYEKGNFEVHGITQEIRDKFSERTKQVEKRANELGIDTPEAKANLGRMTREKKNDNHTWEQLQQIWIERLSQDQLRTIRDTYTQSLGYGFRERPDFSADYTDRAIKELTHQDTWVSERKVITHALRNGIGKVSVEGVQNHLGNLHRSGGIVRRKKEREELTTPDAKFKQIQVMDLWKAGMGKHEKLGRDTYTVNDKVHIRPLKFLMGLRDRYGSVRGNIGRKEAIQSAKASTGAGTVKDVNNLPEAQIWFVETKFPDGDLPQLMQAAVDRDARIIFWGDKDRSDTEEKLRLEPVTLFIKEAKPTLTNRLKKAVFNLIQRTDYGRDRESERTIQTERQASR